MTRTTQTLEQVFEQLTQDIKKWTPEQKQQARAELRKSLRKRKVGQEWIN